VKEISSKRVREAYDKKGGLKKVAEISSKRDKRASIGFSVPLFFSFLFCLRKEKLQG